MSEERNDAGQFTAPSEPLFGQAGIEHEAGYVPMPDDKEEPEELTVQEAAEQLTSSTPEADIQTHVLGADLPENMTLTVEQAAKMFSDSETAHEQEVERLKTEQIRKEVDELRGDKPADEQPKQTRDEKRPEADANDLPIHDDPDIAKALSKPKFVEAIKAYDNQVQQQVSQAVETANDFARMSFAENFPEIANLPPQQWEGALIAMAQHEPERFKSAINSLNRVSQLQTARQQQQQMQQQREQVEFQHYAKAEDARFADMVKGEAPAQMRQIEAEIPKMLSDLGVDPLEFLKAGNESKFLRSAAAQKVLVDAAKYRLMLQAPRAVAARSALPPVQRPGIAAHRTSGADDIAALDRELTQTGSIKAAAKLYAAKSRARG